MSEVPPTTPIPLWFRLYSEADPVIVGLLWMRDARVGRRRHRRPDTLADAEYGARSPSLSEEWRAHRPRNPHLRIHQDRRALRGVTRLLVSWVIPNKHRPR